MRITEQRKIINKTAFLTHDQGTGILYIPVKILDTRKNYGRVDVLVTPQHGSGQAWVNENKLLAVIPQTNSSNEATERGGVMKTLNGSRTV